MQLKFKEEINRFIKSKIKIVVLGAKQLFSFQLVLLVTLPELLRFLGLPGTIAANIRQILYGGLLVAFMIWRPGGLLGEFSFNRQVARK